MASCVTIAWYGFTRSVFTWTRASIDNWQTVMTLNWFCAGCSLPPLSDSFFRDLVQPIPCSETPTELHHVSEQWNFGKTMVIMHLNVRSLLPKMDEIRHRLAGSTPPAIVGFSESWLDGAVSDGEIHIPGYKHTEKTEIGRVEEL